MLEPIKFNGSKEIAVFTFSPKHGICFYTSQIIDVKGDTHLSYVDINSKSTSIGDVIITTLTTEKLNVLQRKKKPLHYEWCVLIPNFGSSCQDIDDRKEFLVNKRNEFIELIRTTAQKDLSSLLV